MGNYIHIIDAIQGEINQGNKVIEKHGRASLNHEKSDKRITKAGRALAR
ncbi:hypothetical protein [Anoxynatronum sibiricum]